MYKGPLFSPSRSIIVFPCLFYHTNSNMYVVIAHCGFDLHFPNDYWCGISILILVGHVHVFFGEMFIPTLCPFKKSGYFCYWVVWVLYIFWILTPHQIHGLHIIFPIPTLLRFHSLVSCVVEKLLILMLSHLYIFTFVTCAFGVLSRNVQCHTTSKNVIGHFPEISNVTLPQKTLTNNTSPQVTFHSSDKANTAQPRGVQLYRERENNKQDEEAEKPPPVKPTGELT